MALIQPPSSDLPDPLHECFVLSLFPRTFKDAQISKDSDSLGSIHNYMKSMALRSPEKLWEKAKGIVHGGSELLNSKLVSDNEAAAAKVIGNPEERRPALGRKRARFSLKPNTSQPSVGLEPSLDIDKLQDPVEFFSAYEKLEYAKEEIHRQTGGNMTEKNEYNPSANPRRRRPGILGKSVGYKHHYSSVVPENDDILRPPQETLQQDDLSPSKFDSQQEATIPDVESHERELAGSMYKSEEKVNKLLDELLSKNIENLGGDGALSLLQERLQIKPLDVDKYIPDLSDIGRAANFMDLEVELQLPKSSRKPLLDIHNTVKGLSGKSTPVKHKKVAENPAHSLLGSPTPPRSPFASFSLLNKRISQSINQSSNAFSALDIDLLPARSASLGHINRQSDQLDTGKELSISGKLKSPVEDEATKTAEVPNSGLGEVIPEEASLNLFGKDLGDHNESNHMDDSGGPIACTNNMLTNGSNKVAENPGDILQEAVFSDTVVSRNGMSDNMEENVEEMQQDTASLVKPNVNNIDDSTITENLKNSKRLLGQSDATVAEDCFMDGQPTITERGPEERTKECSNRSLKDRSKVKRPRERRGDKTLSRRQSLAAAGTYWDAGVRRSNRIRTRPLEYWKGERFLYGRVHESLTTVIGLKCISPSTAKSGGATKFKVTSYVSNEHKELVELAALH